MLGAHGGWKQIPWNCNIDGCGVQKSMLGSLQERCAHLMKGPSLEPPELLSKSCLTEEGKLTVDAHLAELGVTGWLLHVGGVCPLSSVSFSRQNLCHLAQMLRKCSMMFHDI